MAAVFHRSGQAARAALLAAQRTAVSRAPRVPTVAAAPVSTRAACHATPQPLARAFRPTCAAAATSVTRPFHASAIARAVVPFNLADVGEGIVECSVVTWYVKPGDRIAEFDRICEVHSDKATVEITSRYTGVVKKLHYEVGQMARVGQPLVDIEMEGGEGESTAPAVAGASAPATAPSGSGALTAETAHDEAADADGAVFATPAVRRLAKEHKVDLRRVRGTGRDGRILKEDVLRFVENGGKAEAPVAATPSPSTVAAPAAAKPAAVDAPTASSASKPPARPASAAVVPERREPVRGFTKAMIKAMNQSWKTIPHFGYCDEVVMNKVTQLRAQLKPVAERQGVRLSYMPILIKAASIALRDFPILNSSLSADETEIIYKGAHNIGIAMDTPNGLVVPNIKDVQDKSILEIAADINTLQQKGAQGKLSPADLSGGTFTLSNIGSVGGTYMKPVIFAPEVCIGATGMIVKHPRYNEQGEVYPAEILTVSWSADHRIIDGATMARFSTRWKNMLEEPTTLLLNLK